MVRRADRRAQRRRGSRRRDLALLARPVADAFREHQVLTHASAIAFRTLIALVPLALLGVALLGALGLGDVWTDTIGPEVRDRVQPPVFFAIDFSVQEILSTPSVWLIMGAGLLAWWDVAWGVKAVVVALNRIRECEETRGPARVVLTAVGLAGAVGALVIGAFLAVVVVPWGLGWAGGAVLLYAAVWLLYRYAPAEHAPMRWTSAGALLVVAAWIAASLAYGAWIGISSYKSAAGLLVAFLLLTTYLLVSSAILLIGVVLDEELREDR